jgi:hypothetical protein
VSETVYIVFAWTGEYSDRSEWLVCWYESESEARAHARAAKLVGTTGPNPLDPKMQEDYAGRYDSDYTVIAVPRGTMAATVEVPR